MNENIYYHGTTDEDFDLKPIKQIGNLIFTNNINYALAYTSIVGTLVVAEIKPKKPFVYDAKNEKVATPLIKEVIKKFDLNPFKNIFSPYDSLIIKNIYKTEGEWIILLKQNK